MTQFKPEKIKKKELPPLLHPPLIEVIFELRWEIESDPQSGRMRDPAYPMMVGALYERLKKDLPLIEDLPSTQAHPETTPFVPRHRFRKDKNSYPLIQVGPGVLTVNGSKGYSWDGFRSLVTRTIESISELYPENAHPLNFIKAEIRYVNAIRFDLSRENPLQFLEEKLHTRLELDPEHFVLNRLSERPNAVGLNISYVLDRPVGNLALALNLGQFEGKPAFIQQTLIQSFGELTPPDVDSFNSWLDEAHGVAENCLHVFCKGTLMEKFLGG